MKPFFTIDFSKNGLLSLLFLLCASLLTAQTQVSGTVTDAVSGEGLPGVNVVVKNSNNGIVSDVDGKFVLTLSDPFATLSFTYTGYQAQEIPVAGRTTLEVKLAEGSSLINEVVVVAYGTVRKSDLTGTVSSIKSVELRKIPAPDFTQALQGKIQGLDVISSGKPGEPARLLLRGTGTLNGATPIFVVDGVIVNDPSNISANTVESVEVLKDAAAVSLYGARGANGVIMVTTKKGQIQERPTFGFSTYYGVQQVAKRIEMANATEYATLLNEAVLSGNPNAQKPFADPSIFGEGTNWQDQIFQNAPIQNYNLSVRGGSEKATYFISGEVLQQDGIVKSSWFDRYTFRINNDYKIARFLKLGHNLSFNFSKSNSEPGGIIFNAYAADPTVPIRDGMGKYGSTSQRSNVGNPVAQLEYNSYNRKSERRGFGNAYAELYLLKNLTFRTSLGFNWISSRIVNFEPQFAVDDRQRNDNSRLSVKWRTFTDWQSENTLNYNKSWRNHSLGLLAGYSAQEAKDIKISGEKRDLVGVTEDFYYLNAGGSDVSYTEEINLDDGEGFYRYISYLGRINYSFKGRYLVTGAFRRDGSSRFGRDNRNGNFPSLAVAWRVIDEPFMQNVKWLSNLKLRASYGLTGNDKISYLGQYSVISNRLFAVFGSPNQGDESLNFGATQLSVANSFLQWEEAEHSNYGVEFGLLEGKFTAEVDYYQKKTNKILVQLPIPSYVGSKDNPLINAANVSNRGIEWNLNWRDHIGKLSYSIGVNGSTLDNNVLSLGATNEALLFRSGADILSYTTTSSEIGAFYGYKVAGVYQNEAEIKQYPTIDAVAPGDLRFEDVNGDSIVNTDDRVNIGSPMPDLIYGFNLGLELAGFDFGIDFYGNRGAKIINWKKAQRFFGAPNYERSFLDRWTGEGTSNSEPRVTNNSNVNFKPSERFLESGDFFRIRNITLGYSIADRWLKKVRMSTLRIYFTTANPVTWTKYSGFSPEIGGAPLERNIDRGTYPVPRSFAFGLNAGF